MTNEKRRDFLKKAGIFAGTLAAVSLLKAETANAAFTFSNGSSVPMKFLDDGTAMFEQTNGNKCFVTTDGNLVLSKIIKADYVYGGGARDLAEFVPLPPGMFYPMNQVWGYDYNFVKEVKINGNPISFNELTPTSIMPGGYGSGIYCFEGFSWGILSSVPVNTGDVVEATVETREIIASVKGIRAGWKFMPDSIDEKSYEYPIRQNLDSPWVDWDFPKPLYPTGDTKIYWSWPNTNDYSIVIWNLNRFNQSGKKTPGSKGSVKIGKRWKPTKNINAENYLSGIYIKDLFLGASSKNRCARLAVFHKPTGAMSRLSSELIIHGRNRKAGRSGWMNTVKLK